MKFGIIEWSEGKQYERLVYMAGMILIHGCITAPFTLATIHFCRADSPNQFAILAVLTMTIMTSNLAALPTKITIPTFIVSTGLLVLLNIANLLFGIS